MAPRLSNSRWSCAADSRSITAMGPPQRGQRQSAAAGGARAADDSPGGGWGCASRSDRHKGSSRARRRLARNPNERMRTKPRGNTWASRDHSGNFVRYKPCRNFAKRYDVAHYLSAEGFRIREG